jgi:hypothetical protein
MTQKTIHDLQVTLQPAHSLLYHAPLSCLLCSLLVSLFDDQQRLINNGVSCCRLHHAGSHSLQALSGCSRRGFFGCLTLEESSHSTISNSQLVSQQPGLELSSTASCSRCLQRRCRRRVCRRHCLRRPLTLLCRHEPSTAAAAACDVGGDFVAVVNNSAREIIQS